MGSNSLVILCFVFVLCSIAIVSSDVYIFRNEEDWALLTFEERGVIQNYVKCNSEIKDRCDVDPRYLKSPYTQSLAALSLAAIDLVKKNPKFHETAKVLIIGMGPAALGRFWHHHFPNMEIDHVEISQEVVDKVNETLPLPNSPNFHIFVEDAARFMNRQMTSQQKKYDIIIQDAYDARGPVPVLNTHQFYNGIRKLLESTSENGVVLSNMWIINSTFAREIALKYKEVFGNVRVFGIPLTANQEANVIFIGHSMARKDDMVCTDKGCKSKRPKSSRSKPSPICQDGSEYINLGREITTSNNLQLNLEEVLREGWQRRPVIAIDPEFC